MAVMSSKYRGTKEYYLVYAELIEAAFYRGVTTYQELAQIMRLPLQGGHMARATGTILREISEDEVGQGRPMLSAVAVGVSGSPGSGFYKLARDLGKLGDGDEEAFWKSEREAVYEEWRRTYNQK